MKKIRITASKNYDVIIGTSLIENIGQHIQQIKAKGKVCIISDTNVWPLYGNVVSSSLICSGFDVNNYVFPAGEASKNGNVYLSILSFLSSNHFTRSDMLIALGGGVVGDMTGFVAATYLRGVSYIQVPTTLLAMVDSSVGGKTAIDLPEGKNQVGAFYQPEMVLCDIDSLSTLPLDIFRDGCAEVIKYGVLYDPSLFAHLSENGLNFDREHVIATCVSLKQKVVAEDEYDTGSRQQLNLGHTIGHGVEAHSQFQISHGKAVAIGMAIIAKAASAYEICSEHTASVIHELLLKFGLPVSTSFTAEQLYLSSLSDKKRSGGSVNLVVPVQIGQCIIRKTEIHELKSFIGAGL